MATSLKQTTLAAAVGASSNILNLASVTDITAPTAGQLQKIYVVPPTGGRGELMQVVAAASGNYVQVSRLARFKMNFPSGSLVLIGSIDQTVESFISFDPVGAPGNGSALLAVTPVVNVENGNQWLQGTIAGPTGSANAWVPGWGNTMVPTGVTAAVASAAGQITPTGPLFHITGALAITGFLLPIGFNVGSFTVIPDGTFTWTTANNIALAGTAVVSKALTFTYDPVTAKFYPSYIA